MPALRDIQAAFIHDIYSGERSSAQYLADGKAGDQRRLAIYSNNAYLGLTEALAGFFPVVNQIVGDDFFRTAARFYIRQNPLSVGNRNSFGEAFPSFLERYEPCSTLPYLPDVARFEWAYFSASIAQDKPAIDFGQLGAHLESDASFVLRLHPSARILTSECNASDIWLEHQKDEIGQITLRQGREIVVMWRNQADEIVFKKISEAMFNLLSGCISQVPFSAAIAEAGETVKDMEAFQKEFGSLVPFGVFTS